MRLKVVGLISVERNAIRILSRPQPLTLNIYSVGTLTTEQVFLEVFDEGKKTLFKTALDTLFAIHRKLVDEGKASFELRKRSAQHAGAFDTIFVFVQKAHPKNLAMLVNTVIDHFQAKRKGVPQPLLVRKRDEATFFEDEEVMRARIAERPLVASSARLQGARLSDRIVQAASIGALRYLTLPERFRLTEACRSLRKFCDAFVTSLNFRGQPPADVFRALLERFKNLESLSVGCDKLLRKPIEYKGRMLSQLQHLDLAGCSALKEGAIAQLLGLSRRLADVSLPYNSVTFGHFCRLNALKGQIVSLKLKGARLEPFRVNHRSVRDFLEENNCLQKLAFLQLESKSLQTENLPVAIRTLKIRYYVTEDKSCAELKKLITANPQLEDLAISHIVHGGIALEFPVDEEAQPLMQAMRGCLSLKCLTVGSFFSNSMIRQMCDWIEQSSVDLFQLHICNLSADSEDLLRLIEISPNLRKIDMSDSRIPTSYLASRLGPRFHYLKQITLRASELDVHGFREFLSHNKLGRVRVVYKSM